MSELRAELGLAAWWAALILLAAAPAGATLGFWGPVDGSAWRLLLVLLLAASEVRAMTLAESVGGDGDA